MGKLRRAFVFIVVAAFIGALMLPLVPQPVYAMTGSGTVGDPYIIYNVTDLQDMNLALGAYYELGNDIDAWDTVTWNGGAGFAPVGDLATPFTGSLDGNGYVIDGLYIDRSGTDYVGLFGYLESGLGDEVTIQNLGIINADITGRKYVGIISGYMGGKWAYIHYCYTHGQVHAAGLDANAQAGGLFGVVVGTSTGTPGAGYIDHCFSLATVTGAASYVGGLIGTGTVNLSYSFALGNVYETVGTGDYVGGLIGRLASATYSCLVNDCYAMGLAAGDQHVGGLIGAQNDASSIVDNCYSTGSIVGNSYAGGLMGWNDGTCTSSFWDMQTSGTTWSAAGTGKNTTQMKTESTFTGAGWDFNTIWGIGGTVNGGYPYLLWWYNPFIWEDYEAYQVLWFQPNAIVNDTTLPDRAETEDGIITWGANPEGINITHSGLDLDETYYDYMFEPIFPGSSDIIKPEPGTMTNDIDTDKLAKNPLTPLFQAISDATGGQLPLRLIWLGFAILVLVASMVYVQLKTEHITFTSLTGLGVSVLFYVGGAFPLWVVILLAIGLIASIIAERQPVL